MRMGSSDTITVSLCALGKRIWLWSLELLQVLQKLLDLPTFIVILQELLGHDDMSVRQKALQILGQRLLSRGEKKPAPEEVMISMLD